MRKFGYSLSDLWILYQKMGKLIIGLTNKMTMIFNIPLTLTFSEIFT